MFRNFTLKKIIIKSAFITLGILAGCAVLVFAVLSLGFPSTVARWSYQLGNYGMATKYAALYYSYTGETEDIALCAEYSIISGKDSYIIKYCEKLIDRDDFAQYCAEYDAAITEYDAAITEAYPLLEYSYRQVIYGKLAQAYYSAGDLQNAIGTAVEAVVEDYDRKQYALGEELDCTITCFPVSNAIGSLALKIISSGDGDAANYLLQIFQKVQTEKLVSEQLTYFTKLQTYLQNIAS